MFQGKVYKRRAKEGLLQNNNNNECCWVPETPVKEHRVSKGNGLIDLIKNIHDEWQHVDEEAGAVSEVLVDVDLDLDNEKEEQLVELNVATPASQESANLSVVLDSGNEPEPDPEKERDGGNHYLHANSNLLPNWNEANNVKNLQNCTNSPESCGSQPAQQNVPEKMVVQKEEDEVSGTGVENSKKVLKRRPKRKPKRKKIRPRVLVEGKPKKTPQPKRLNPVTPKCANEIARKRKYVRKNVKENFVSGYVVDENVSKKRKSVRLSCKKNSDAIIELPPPPRTCRQALNFNLESKDDKAIIIVIPECRVQVDECDITKAIPECEVQVNECVDTRKQCENSKTRGTRSKRRRRLNTLFMHNVPVLQVQYPRRRRTSRATRRCNIISLAAIPICSQLPKLPSKQAAPRENAIPICSQLPKFPSKQGAPSENAIPICSQLPKLPSRQAAPSEKEEAEIINELQASKNMLLTNNIGRNVAGRTEIKSCVFDYKENEGSALKYEDFPLTSYLTGIDSQDPMIRKHPLELENFELVDLKIGSQKVLQEPGVGLREGLQEHGVFSLEFLQEQRMGALPPFLEQRIDSAAPFPGQISGIPTPFPGQTSGVLAPFSGQSMCDKKALQNVGVLRLFLEQNIGAVESSFDQSNSALGLFPRQEIYSPKFLKELAMYRHLQKQIIGPGSQQVLQEEDPVIQKKSLKPEDFWLTARGSQGITQIERNYLPTQKRPPCHSRGPQVGMTQQLMQTTTADIIRKFEALTIRDGGSQLMKLDNKGYGLSSGQGTVVPYKVKKEKRNKLPEVDLDPRTLRMWNLIMKIDDGTSKDQTGDEDMEKWWEKEREVFGGRIQSFTARIHLILGDRRFKPWKGSVVDSVVGVYLTQNVSDNFSSSAYMSLAARFPLKSTNNHTESDENFTITAGQESIRSNLTSHGAVCDSEGNMYFVTEPESDMPCELKDKDRVDPFDSRIQGKSLLEIEDMRVNAVASQKFDISSVKSLNRIQLSPIKDFAFPNNTCSAESSITASTETLLLRNLHDKVDEILFCDECLDGCTTPRRMDDGSQVSTPEKYDLKSDCTDFNDPFEISVFPLNQESSGTDMPQANEGTPINKKTPGGKEPILKESKSNMKKDGTKKTTRKKKDDNQKQNDWDALRRIYSNGVERSPDQMDSVDWEAVRCAEVNEIADAIKDRGQQNIIAGRIKDFLNRLVELHSTIDLEWLRNVPPDKVKEYLLDIQGLGLKSVECVRLLSLQHIAFPVDVNVGRIAVRLGWVPLQPLPGDLHIHLLEEYPVMDTIQKYLWPRLSCLNQKTLYELHYQMITFGKVFCKKKNPNCGACPLRGECKHFASAFASARLALPGPSEKGIVTSEFGNGTGGNPPSVVNPIPVICIETDPISESGWQTNCEPIIEEPESPGPQCEESLESDIYDDYSTGDIEDIPTIRLQEKEFKENVQNFIEMNQIMIQDSSALVHLTAEAASMPAMKLKKYAHLRTEHMVYVLPDNHELLRGFERRDPDDPSPYLLAIWLPGETPNSIVPPQHSCNSKESKFCNVQMCYSCNSNREKNAGVVRGTILIPCRSANRGRFPLNGTYFQVNEVFADHETSNCPINVPRHMIANLPRQKVLFGTSATSIFNALHLREIQECFWRGFVCVRGFDRRNRCPRPLTKRLHCPPSKMKAGGKRSRYET